MKIFPREGRFVPYGLVDNSPSGLGNALNDKKQTWRNVLKLFVTKPANYQENNRGEQGQIALVGKMKRRFLMLMLHSFFRVK